MYNKKNEKKHFKNEQRSGIMLQKKSYIHVYNTSGVGISNIMRKSIYMYVQVRTSLQQHPLTTPIQTEVWMAIVESGWNLWVWLVCVISRKWVWLAGGGCGYKYSIGVVSGWCC